MPPKKALAHSQHTGRCPNLRTPRVIAGCQAVMRHRAHDDKRADEGRDPDRSGPHAAVGKRRIVGEVRGRGLMVCVEFVEPDGSGHPLDQAQVAKLDRKAWDRGAIVYARGRVVRLAPPLCITREEVDRLVDIVAGSIEELDAELS